MISDQIPLWMPPPLNWKTLLQEEALSRGRNVKLVMQNFQFYALKLCLWKTLVPKNVEQISEWCYFKLKHANVSHYTGQHSFLLRRKINQAILELQEQMRIKMGSLIIGFHQYVCANILILRDPPMQSRDPSFWAMPTSQYEAYIYYKYFEKNKLWCLPVPAIDSKQSLSKWYMTRCFDETPPAGGFDRRHFIMKRQTLAQYATFIKYHISKNSKLKNPQNFRQLSITYLAKQYADWTRSGPVYPDYEGIAQVKQYLCHPYFTEFTLIFSGNNDMLMMVNQDSMVVTYINPNFNKTYKQIVNSLSNSKRQLQVMLKKTNRIPQMLQQWCVYDSVTKKTIGSSNLPQWYCQNIFKICPPGQQQYQGYENLENNGDIQQHQGNALSVKFNERPQQFCPQQFVCQPEVMVQVSQNQSKFSGQQYGCQPEVMVLSVPQKQSMVMQSEELNQDQIDEQLHEDDIQRQIVTIEKCRAQFVQQMRQRRKKVELNDCEQPQNTSKPFYVRHNTSVAEVKYDTDMSLLHKTLLKLKGGLIKRNPFTRNYDFLNSQQFIFIKMVGRRKYARHPGCGQWVQVNKMTKHQCPNQQFNFLPSVGKLPLGCISLFRPTKNRAIGLCVQCGHVSGVYNDKVFHQGCVKVQQSYSLFPQYSIIQQTKYHYNYLVPYVKYLQPLHEKMIFTEDICPAVESHIFARVLHGNRQCFVDDIKTPHINGIDLRQTAHGVFADCDIPRGTYMGFYGGDLIPLDLFDHLRQNYQTGVVFYQDPDDPKSIGLYPVQHYRCNHLLLIRIELHSVSKECRGQLHDCIRD